MITCQIRSVDHYLLDVSAIATSFLLKLAAGLLARLPWFKWWWL